jgi:hypothetical protein
VNLSEPGYAWCAPPERRRVSLLIQFAYHFGRAGVLAPGYGRGLRIAAGAYSAVIPATEREQTWAHPPLRRPCGCPLDADCDGYHPGALDGWPP